MKFHERLVAERKRLGMTQKDFAVACGVRPATQLLYEKGDRSPNSEYLSLAIRCGVDLSMLFHDDGKQTSCPRIAPAEVESIYIECDHLCRDRSGRLLDLEERVKVFRDLYVSRATYSEKLVG